MFSGIFGLQKKITFCLLVSGVWLLLFSANLSNCCYASQVNSLSDFESQIDDIMSYMSVDNDNYKALTKLFYSNAWLENKSMLPFGTYDNLILRCTQDTSTKWYIEFLFYDSNNITFTVNSESIVRSESFTVKYYRFNIVNLSTTYNPRYDGQQSDLTIATNALARKISTNYKFSIFFVDNEFINAQNLDVWGVNYPIVDYYSFIYNSNLQNVYIDDFDTLKQISSSEHGSSIAEFGKTSHFGGATITYWKYERSRGYFEPLIVKSVNSYNILSNDLGELYFTYDMFIPNTIMQFILKSNDLDNYSSLSLLFYCVDSNTVIDGSGNLDINNTFDDDYYIRYNNVINNILNTSGGVITNPSGDVTGYIDLEPIKNSIDNLTDSSQVDSILGEYITSGEILGAMNYHTYGDLYHDSYSVPVMYLFNRINDVLLDSGDVYFDIPLRNGTVKRLYSSDFIVPENGFKSFVRAFMVFSTVFVLYLHFKNLIEDINSADLKSLTKEQVDMNIVKM